jgi:hypothetical protein
MFNKFRINYVHCPVNFAQDGIFEAKILNFGLFTGLNGRPYVKRDCLENQDINRHFKKSF